MTHIQLPAVILVRGGSRRLPRKALLPWNGESLLSNAVIQTGLCRGVSRVIVATDDLEYAEHARACMPGPRVVMRPPVDHTQSSYADLGWVMRQMDLSASYVLLIQCTSPFINPVDLSSLYMAWLNARPAEVVALGIEKEGGQAQPSGMGYIVSPRAHQASAAPTDFIYVPQQAPADDVDTFEDYHAALEKTASFQTYQKAPNVR